MRLRLREIPEDQARRDAERLADRVLDLPEVQNANDVFLCLSFGVEIDTWRLAERLADDGKRTYVPRVVLKGHPPDENTLHVHPYPCQLETQPMGLRQPAADESKLADEEIDQTIDVALILGLAFDAQGVRLGHGGGFFDRFLARHPLRTAGLAYDEQIVDLLPRESHDVPMDCVVTPRQVVTQRQS